MASRGCSPVMGQGHLLLWNTSSRSPGSKELWLRGLVAPSHIKEISPEYSLEGLMLKLKLQYFSHLMRRADIRKDPDARKYGRQEEKGTTKDEMIGWHHQLNGHEFEQVLGDEGQGSLECCSPWGRKELDMTERLNNNNHLWNLPRPGIEPASPGWEGGFLITGPPGKSLVSILS